jgi:hypothetical protein
VLLCACPLLFAIVLRCAGLYLPALKRLPDQLVLQAGWPRSRVGYSIVSEPFDRPCLKRWTEQLQPVSGHQGTFTVCALEISTADRLARMARLTYKFAFRVTWTRYPNASGHEAVGDCIPDLSSPIRPVKPDLSSPIRPVKSTGPAHSRAASPGSSGIRADNFNSTQKLIFPQLYHSATTVTSCSPNGNSSAKRVASVDTTPSNTSSTPLIFSSDSVALDDDQKIADLVGVVYVANWIDLTDSPTIETSVTSAQKTHEISA